MAVCTYSGCNLTGMPQCLSKWHLTYSKKKWNRQQARGLRQYVKILYRAKESYKTKQTDNQKLTDSYKKWAASSCIFCGSVIQYPFFPDTYSS